MTNQIQSIPIDKLVPHPDNPNQMSKANFNKLIRNIKLSGRYEPLVVRPCPSDQVGGNLGYFQIINGHHRWQALIQLGYKEADAVVWDINDQQADILLATLNRLAGSDILDKKIALLTRLNRQMEARELAKLLPQTAKQIERLTDLKDSLHRASSIEHQVSSFANPLVFFVDDQQKQKIEKALSLATTYLAPHFTGGFSAIRNAMALTVIAEEYLVGRNEKA
jgi:ParB/RepB/Spo0J family partition protein